jgi:hypothetical protein
MTNTPVLQLIDSIIDRGSQLIESTENKAAFKKDCDQLRARIEKLLTARGPRISSIDLSKFTG